MNGQLSHARSELVTRAELMTIPPPPPTPTWRPIAHGDLLTAIDRQLLVRGITIRKEQFAIQRAGARLFAVLDLSIEGSTDCCAAMGVRTANDRSMALEIAVGVKVFVCDNLAFSGDLIALRRKHTARFDLNADISRAVDRYQQHLTLFTGQLDRLKERQLSHEQAKAMVYEAVTQQIVPLRLLPAVSALYQTYTDPPTAWTLHNIFTASLKQLAPAPAFAATVELGKFFGLTSQN